MIEKMYIEKQKKMTKFGKPPGELIYTGKVEPSNAIINVISYSESSYEEYDNVEFEFLDKLNKDKIHWVNFINVSDKTKLKTVGEKFNLHKLTLEDIINVNQRTKVEFFDTYTFVVIKVFRDLYEKLEFRQLSIIAKENILITFLEENNYTTDLLKEQLKNNAGNIREKDFGYLIFSLMDIATDSYFSRLNSYISSVEEIDAKMTEEVEEQLFINIKQLKQEILRFRRFVFPLKEILFQLQRKKDSFITEKNELYYMDLYDHSVRINESIEILRENLNNITEIYLSIVSNRLNEIMRILTIISTLFIPLTFIAGIYGMNFVYMPELQLKYGYFVVLGIMVVIAIIMIIIFKRKKWF